MELPQLRTHERRRRVVCLAVLALQALYSFALVPAVPSLIGRDPVLLEALRSSTAAMIAAGAFARAGQASLAFARCRPRVWGNRAGVASALTDKSKLMEVHPHEEGSPQRMVAPRA